MPGTIYVYNLNGGKIRDINIAGIGPLIAGIATDGKNILIAEVSAAAVYVVDINGETLRKLPAFIPNVGGLAYDQRYIHFAQTGGTNHHIVTINRDGVEIQRVDTSGINTSMSGITYDQRGFWVTDYLSDVIQHVSRDGNKLNEIDISGIDSYPSDIAFNGKNLWLVTIGTGLISQIDLAGNLISQIDISAYGWIHSYIDFSHGRLYVGGY